METVFALGLGRRRWRPRLAHSRRYALRLRAADATTLSTGDANATEDTAEALANYLLTTASGLMPGILSCTSLGGASDAEIDGCMDGFIERFGARAAVGMALILAGMLVVSLRGGDAVDPALVPRERS